MTKARGKSALRYPLSGILSSEARVDVLRELFRHGGELSAPQLVIRTGLAQSSVREALIALEATQVIEVLGAGKAMLYRANRRHPFREGLESLFAHEESRYSAIGEGIRGIVSDGFNDEVEAVWLFGSVARGEDGFYSDLDLAILARSSDISELAARIRESLRPLQDRLLFRASVIALTRDDMLRLREENAPLLQSLENEAIAILGKRPADLLAG
jgi:predicted nucleotidyltransferase